MHTRSCPTCGKTIEYTTARGLVRALERNNSCRKCSFNSPEHIAKNRENYNNHLGKLNFKGINNPFYGKTHTEESKQYMGKRGERCEKEKQRLRALLKKHSNRRSIYDIWNEKYGVDIANEKKEKLRQKQSVNASGSNNHMYGKPAPKGSGNGWKGWYKGWFFRSLRELSYMVNVIEANNWTWCNAEKKKFKVQYIDWEGKTRNYFPDFLVNNNTIIEIKPKKLWNTPTIQSKKQYAVEHFRKMGYNYEIVDQPLLAIQQIKTLIVDGSLRFQERYTKLLEKYLENSDK